MKAIGTLCGGIILGLVLLLPGPIGARGHHHRRPSPSKPTAFDYYVLSLSWSPEHCTEQPGGPTDPQCGTDRHYAFVVHGLWPQYDNGGYPQSCSISNHLPAAVVDSTLDIMPSKTLIQHEWQKHGTCSGLAADAYFQRARQAFHAVTIPDRYQRPDTAFRVSAADVRADFGAANPSWPAKSTAVLCTGHFFTEVRVCLSKDLGPRACGAKVSDTCEGQVTVRPVR
jgi:ribonuclease T2